MKRAISTCKEAWDARDEREVSEKREVRNERREMRGGRGTEDAYVRGEGGERGRSLREESGRERDGSY